MTVNKSNCDYFSSFTATEGIIKSGEGFAEAKNIVSIEEDLLETDSTKIAFPLIFEQNIRHAFHVLVTGGQNKQ